MRPFLNRKEVGDMDIEVKDWKVITPFTCNTRRKVWLNFELGEHMCGKIFGIQHKA